MSGPRYRGQYTRRASFFGRHVVAVTGIAASLVIGATALAGGGHFADTLDLACFWADLGAFLALAAGSEIRSSLAARKRARERARAWQGWPQ